MKSQPTSGFRHLFAHGVQEQVQLGIGGEIWRPSVPHPLYVGFGLRKAQCGCGKKFNDYQQYKEHFVYMAVWQNESQFIPTLLQAAREGKA